MSLWEKIIQSPSYRPAQITIIPENTDIRDRLIKPFKRNEQYFLVRINEMYLSYKRKLWSTYDPMVFVLSEFMYNGIKDTSVPFVVGPSILDKKIKVPEGMILKNTTVAGLHPFRGGQFAVSVVLARLQQSNYPRKILELIENVSGAYSTGFITMINQYSQVAKVILNGIETLLGTKDVDPLIGFRNQYETNIDEFRPTYFVLINKDEAAVDEANFFVKNDSLLFGDSMNTAKPYRDNDYVLYSIMAAPHRNDYESLPFNTQWLDLVNTIDTLPKINKEDKEIINAKLFALQSAVENSPDLIRPQVDQLIEEYIMERDQRIARRSKRLSGSSEPQPESPTLDEWEKKMRAQSLRILRS